MPLRHLISFATLGLFWGGSFLAIHFVVDGLPPAFGAFLRVLTCFLATSALLPFRPRMGNAPRLSWQAFGAGMVNFGIPFILLFSAERTVSPALASIYNATAPVFIALLTPLLLPQSRLSQRHIAGIALGFAGILAVFGPKISARDLVMIGAQTELIGMALCYALGTIWVRRIGQHVESAHLLWLQSLGGLFALAIFTSLFEAPWTIDVAAIPPTSIAAILYLGICSTFIAWLIFLRLIRERGAAQAASVTYLVPPISILLDWMVFGKMVGAADILGAGIILSGVWLIQHQAGTALAPSKRDILSKEAAT